MIIHILFTFFQLIFSQDALPYLQFFKQPQKQSVTREMLVRIECGATGGIGSLTYTFYKGSTPQHSMMSQLGSVSADPGTQLAEWLIPRVTAQDEGYYQCLVRDEADITLYSSVVYLRVQDYYLQRPTDFLSKTVELISTTKVHVLNCTMPVSNPPALPKWFRDGALVETDDSHMFVSYGDGEIEGRKISFGDLVLYGVDYTHSGQYTCAAFNYELAPDDSQIDMISYTVTVTTSGDVGTFKSTEVVTSSVTVNVGEEAYHFCGGVGNPSPEVEFVVVSPETSTDTKSRLIRIGSELTTTPGLYTATCKVGTHFFTTKLTVVEPPYNSVDSVEFVEDSSAAPIIYYMERDSPPESISCHTSASLAKQWYRNGQVWNRKAYHEVDLNSGFDLIANDVRPDDSGVYQCKAFNDEVSIYRTQVLVVVKQLSVEPISPSLREHEGNPKKLSCTFTGGPVPAMIWTLDDKKLESSDRMTIMHDANGYPYVTTLEILETSIYDTGIYVCGARTWLPAIGTDAALEDSVTASINLKVVAAVSVTSPNATSVLSFRGKELVLVCRVYGEPFPTEPIWSHEGKVLVEGSGGFEINNVKLKNGYNSTLKIYSVSLANKGNYTCNSTNMIDFTREGAVTISVPVISPIEIGAPDRAELESGLTERITCNATGYPPASEITWALNNQTLTENIETVSFGEDIMSVLTLRDVQPGQDGNYTCSSSNRYTDNIYTDSRVIRTKYVSPVTVNAKSASLTGVYGKPLVLQCSASGVPLPDVIEWESRGYIVNNNKNIDIRMQNIVLEDNTTAIISTLSIGSVRYATERVYNCSARNYLKDEYRVSHDSVSVIVEYPVEVRTRSDFAYNTKGQPVDVVCEIEGKPLPNKIYWYFAGQEVSDSEYYMTMLVSNGNRMNATLRINSLTSTLAGDYNCSASNIVDGVERTSSRKINVDQVRRVIVSVLSGVISVAKGEETNLTCSGEGVPPPEPSEIEWKYDGYPGKVLPRYHRKYLIENTKERIYKVNSVLRISDTQLDDEGYYTCKFSNMDRTNSSFEDEKIIQLIVQVPVEVSFEGGKEAAEVFDGESYELTCNIFGKPAPDRSSIQWVNSKTGEIITSGGTYGVTTRNLTNNWEQIQTFLTINSMSLALEGTYECWAQNMLASGKVVQSPAYKKVVRVEAAKINSLRSVAGEVGYAARLSCSATGTPAPEKILWAVRSEAKSRPVIDSDEYDITQEPVFDNGRGMYTRIDSTLIIRNVRWSMGGSYECSTSNTIRGETHSSYDLVTLNVGQRVAVNLDTAQPLQTLLAGQVGVLSVPLYGFPAPSVSWTPSSAGNLSFIPVEVYSGVSQLTIPSVSLSHGGVYTVTAENTLHNVSYHTSFEVTVEVYVPPSITLLPSVELLELTTERVGCVVRSRPRPSEISWSRGDGQEEVEVEPMVVEEGGNLSVSSRNLLIKQARLESEGEYTCTARVFIGGRFYTEQKSVKVTVVSATVVSARETNVEAVPGMDLNITCTAQGSPLPEAIIWKVNRTVLYGSNLVSFKNREINHRKIQSVLVIRDLQPEQFGEYECSTFNIVLGQVKSDSVIISVFGVEKVTDKAITAKELLIIAVLAAILFVVLAVVMIMVFCRWRNRRHKTPVTWGGELSVQEGGADSTLRAEGKDRTGLIQIDPMKPEASKEYIDLDPRVYKVKPPQPLPRNRKHGHYTELASQPPIETSALI